MDLDDGGVDHGVFHVWRLGAGLKKPGENIRLDPVAVALEDSVPIAEERRKITPRASRPHDPEDCFDEAAVVASAAPGVRRLTQTMRLHLRPLGVCQYESLHLKLESQPSLGWNPDSQQTLVYEQYAAGQDQNGLEPAKHATFDATTKHNGNSMTKSVTSLLVGVALERGWIKALDTPVLDYFPEYADLLTPQKSMITLYHLLTMSDGLEWFEFKKPFDSHGKMRGANDAYRYVLERPIITPQGHTYNYNSGATELIGAVLRKVSGKSLDTLARDELFGPLSIEDVEWIRRLPDGQPQASAALRARPRDWAKLGQLVLNRGVWNGRQIVPSAWIARLNMARSRARPSIWSFVLIDQTCLGRSGGFAPVSLPLFHGTRLGAVVGFT